MVRSLGLSVEPLPLRRENLSALSPTGTVLAGMNVLSLPAVDEQNAQTQEQQGFVLGLSESEKKDLKTDNRVCTSSAHSESCVVAKGRSHRKGKAGLWFLGDTW